MSEQETSRSLTANAEAGLPSETGQPPIVHPAIKGVSDLSIVKQVGLMLGLAFSVAVGVAVVLWSQAPSYDLLFPSLAERDAAEVLEVLGQLELAYKIDERSGAIMVKAGAVREIKLKLAAQGLPRSSSLGYELLDKETSFTTSKNVELKRFQRALEGEISRTISSIQNVKKARVLLALPKQSVFVRKQKKPSASVILDLYRGRSLDKGQIEAIIYLVASSVPLMEASQVTVVDQTGRLLSSKGANSELSLTTKQFGYKNELEEHLMTRIENILMPIVGQNGMRVQVSADVDFTVTEKTQEMFNPDLPALRSEQTTEDQNSSSALQGVPGALSNQPPPAGIAPEVATGGEEGAEAGRPRSLSKTATRNFELDKTITHTKLATGIIRRLSVAVVIDNQKIFSSTGDVNYLPFSQENLNRFTDLVKQSIGYDMRRGDIVTLTNIAFRIPDELEMLPEIPLWEQSWLLNLLKQVAAVLVVLFIIFGVLRPTMRGLVAKDKPLEIKDENGDPIAVRYDNDGNAIAIKDDSQSNIGADGEDLLLLESPQSYEKRLEYVQKLVDDDPKLVAQVIKTWVSSDVK